MRIGSDAPILASLPPIMIFFLGTISSPGLPSASRQCPVRVLRPSIAPWPMASLKPVGYARFWVSFVVPFAVPPLFIVTTLVQSTSPPTPFSTSALSMRRLTYTSFVNALPLVKFVSCMFLHRPSMPISSLKGYRCLFLQSLGPVLMVVVLSVPTAGAC